MSSRGSKGKSKAPIQRTEQAEWSQWTWDPRGYQYYRTRLQPNGTYAYEYQAADPAATPRSEANSSTAPYVVPSSSSGSATGDPQYYGNRNYGFSEERSSVDTLADDFSSKASISSPSTSSASYNRSESYNDGASGSNASSNDYGGSGWAPSGSFAVATASGRSFPSSSGGYGVPGSVSGNSVGFNEVTEPQPTSAVFGVSSPSDLYNSPTNPGTQALPSVAEQGGSGALTPKAPNTISGAIGAQVGESEALDSRFRVHNSSSFKIGQVFKVLWSEPQGVTTYSNSNNTDVTSFTIGKGRYGEKVYQSIRRFVIVASGHGHSQCIPILTYNHRGASKSGIEKKDHAVIWMVDTPPKQLSKHAAELKNEPVQIRGNSPRDKLDDDSCINYAKIYNVEHNVKVFFIGRLTSTSQKRVLLAVNEAWHRNTSVTRSNE